jgi:hypothetical protein
MRKSTTINNKLHLFRFFSLFILRQGCLVSALTVYMQLELNFFFLISVVIRADYCMTKDDANRLALSLLSATIVIVPLMFVNTLGA